MHKSSSKESNSKGGRAPKAISRLTAGGRGSFVPVEKNGNNILAESNPSGDDGRVWRSRRLDFLSGLPSEKRNRRLLLMVHAYVDDAGGKGQSSVFVFSAVLAAAKDWAKFSDEWQAILDSPPSIDYFKFYEASQWNGQFKRFSLSDRDEKIKKLLVPMKGLIEVFCIADMAGFSETLGKYNARPSRDPYFQQFYILIMAISFTLLDLGIKEPFEIFFDEHRIFGPKAKAWYPIVRYICDDDIRSLMPVEPRFESDEEFLPLQAADMLAGIRRAWNDKSMEKYGLSWLIPELEQNSGILLSAHSQYLDRDRMMGIIKRSYSPETQERVRQVVRELRAVYGADWTPPFMNKKHTADEFEKFDSVMRKLVRVSHDELKAKLDAEKAKKSTKPRQPAKKRPK